MTELQFLEKIYNRSNDLPEILEPQIAEDIISEIQSNLRNRIEALKYSSQRKIQHISKSDYTFEQYMEDLEKREMVAWKRGVKYYQECYKEFLLELNKDLVRNERFWRNKNQSITGIS